MSKNWQDEVKKLQKCCESEGYELKLNWDMLAARMEKDSNHIFHYEDSRLAGFAAFYDFGNKWEVCGMVHPDYRRKGIFTNLILSKIRDVLAVETSRILLNVPHLSKSGKEFLKKFPCQYRFSEYQMEWVPAEREKELAESESYIRPAAPEDAELEIQLDVQCFGFTEEEARSYYKRTKQEAMEKFIIEEDGEAVGKIQIQPGPREAWIYGFSILPEYQGRGIGRTILRKVCLQEYRKGRRIFLEVEAANEGALRLYTSSGFVIQGQQDYYEYQQDLSNGKKTIPAN